jgi:hypothetical protein
MAVTTIDPRHSVLSALQMRLGTLASRSRGARPAGSAAARQASQTFMAQRLQAIDRTDPDRRRKAVRVVLELELARAFGTGLLNDPGFPQMVDAVQDQMQGDGQAAAAVHALGDLLLAAR